MTRIRNSDLAEITRIIKGADESLPREDYRFLYIMRSLIMIRIILKKRTLRNHLKPRRLILGRNLIYRFFILSSVFSSGFYYFFKLSAIRYDVVFSTIKG